jgi:hypothetical protein
MQSKWRVKTQYKQKVAPRLSLYNRECQNRVNSNFCLLKLLLFPQQIVSIWHPAYPPYFVFFNPTPAKMPKEEELAVDCSETSGKQTQYFKKPYVVSYRRLIARLGLFLRRRMKKLRQRRLTCFFWSGLLCPYMSTTEKLPHLLMIRASGNIRAAVKTGINYLLSLGIILGWETGSSERMQLTPMLGITWTRLSLPPY